MLAGDSAGGNFAVTTAMKLKTLGLRQPDLIFSFYPAAIVRSCVTPSRFLSLIDPLLPFGIMISCLQVMSRTYIIRIHVRISDWLTCKISYKPSGATEATRNNLRSINFKTFLGECTPRSTVFQMIDCSSPTKYCTCMKTCMYMYIDQRSNLSMLISNMTVIY